MRGDLLELRASGGNFALSSVSETCLANNTPATFAGDPTLPGSGAGFWYLIRAIDAGGKATCDGGSAFQVDYRDDEIASSSNDCP